jgi:hypothetical protein
MPYEPVRKNKRADYPFPLDNPPRYHYKLLDYGERPYWTPDSKRIVFVESNYGDISEITLDTREVRNLTKDLGIHHSFLRVLVLPNGDYLLIGPAEFKDRYTSRHIDSELWFMGREAKNPPVALGQKIFEGIGVSRIANKITFAISGEQDPRVGGKDHYEVHVADLEYVSDGIPKLVNNKVIYSIDDGHRPEPQDFRFDDTEVIMAEYFEAATLPDDRKICEVKGINVNTGEVRLYITEPGCHNECEGIFPNDENYICLESTARDRKYGRRSTDLWKLKLDGSGSRVRMTRFIDCHPWRATNSNVSPDGKWLAFMLNILDTEAGYGMGLGLLDLEAWGKSEYANHWDIPDVMKKK